MREATSRSRSSVVLVALVCGLWPARGDAQFGRDVVVSRLVELARRDAPSAALSGDIETGRLAQGQVVTRAYRLAQGSCYWFLAVGDGNLRDIDLVVRSRGIEIVRDQSTSSEAVVPGERPYCPEDEQRIQIRLLAFRGGGVYATAVYAAAATGIASGQDGPPDVAALLDRAAARYAPGMARDGEVITTRLAEAEDLTNDRRLAGGVCYRFIAVGGAGVGDLELMVLQGSSEVARDSASASEAVGSYCATVETPVRIRIGMARGAGEVAWAVYSGGGQHGVERPGAEPVASFPVGGTGDDYLARQLRSLHGRVGEGRHGASDVMRTELRTSEDRVFPVRLEAGRCYTIVAVGSPSIRNLDLYLIDPSGMEIASDTGPEASAVIRTSPCPRWSGSYSVRVRAFAGYGPVAVQAFGN